MKKLFLIISAVVLLFACEDIYTPRLEEAAGVIVADARIVAGKTGNVVYLYKTVGFNNKSEVYPPVEGASVSIIDDKGSEVKLAEIKKGSFNADIPLNQGKKYKLKIVSGADIYESALQEIYETPAIDTLYGEETEKITVVSGTKNVNNFEKTTGVQLYVDVNKAGKLSYYRFYARKVLQYNYELQMGDQESHTMYGWKSVYPTGTFNIAGPADYSASPDIKRHPVEFFEKQPYKYLLARDYPAGWIYLLYQYGISETTYNYYSSLNDQLEANGKLFDPMYVQPEGTIRCTNDPEKVILGNFEISTFREYRFFINYSTSGKSFKVKRLLNFYDIPGQGVVQDIPPVFWER